MASTLYKRLFGILHRSHSNAAFKSLLNFKRTLSIPPLNIPSRDTEIDGLYSDNNEPHFSPQKIYEIRTYTIRPKDYKKYMKFTEDSFHLRFKHSNLFGLWSPEFKAPNEIIHIWEYDNHEHRAKVRQALSADTEWQSNYVNKVAPMCISQTNATMMLLPWSIITLPCRSGVYELQIFNMNSHTDRWDGKLKAAMEMSSLKLTSFNSVLIGCFTSVFGPQNTTYALWQHESFDKFPFGCLKLLKETNLSDLHAFYHEVRIGYSKDCNWRSFNSGVFSRVKFLFNNLDLFADVAFEAQGQLFKGHKLIMALGSPFFERVFYHTPYAGPVPIPIRDVTPEAFRCVMQYLYTDRVTFKGDYEAFATYVASHHFEMDSLKTECEDYISSLDIQPQNVWSRLENASRLLMAKIERKCLVYVQRNTLQCLTNDAFLSANPDSVLRLLQMEILEVSEITLLEWLMCWAKRNIGTDHNLYLREFLAPCLIHIRFKAITAKEFCRFTKNYPYLLDENDVLKILQYLELPHSNELPQWCCKLTSRKRY